MGDFTLILFMAFSLMMAYLIKCIFRPDQPKVLETNTAQPATSPATTSPATTSPPATSPATTSPPTTLPLPNSPGTSASAQPILSPADRLAEEKLQGDIFLELQKQRRNAPTSSRAGARLDVNLPFIKEGQELVVNGVHNASDGHLEIHPGYRDRAIRTEYNVIMGNKEKELLKDLKEEADSFFSKGFYDDKGKTCAVFLNYSFPGCTDPNPRTGAKEDTKRLKKLFQDMGIDEESIIVCEQDRPYEEIMDEVINTVGRGGYSSLIFAIGTHGGSTQHSLRVLDKWNEVVEIDLYEDIVYVLSKKFIEIPKIFWVQACRDGQEKDLHKIKPVTNPDTAVAPQEVCVVMATIPNREAKRSFYDGSFFFTEMDTMIREGAKKGWGLRKIVLEVGKKIVNIKECYGQVPQTQSIQCNKDYKFKGLK